MQRKAANLGALLVALLFASRAGFGVDLDLSKSGDDIVLSWAGGSGTYDVIRSSSSRMSTDTQILLDESTETEFNDSEALGVNGIPSFRTYVVSDAAELPSLDIVTPCNSGGTICTATTTASFVIVSGITDSPNPVYVNDREATAAPGTFAKSVDLFPGTNLVTAATRGTNGDWAFDFIQIDRLNGNTAPSIAVVTPADGSTIHDLTPLIQIEYSDAEPMLNLDDLRIYIDGTVQGELNGDEFIQKFDVTSTTAAYQVVPNEALSLGSHFVYATIRDADRAVASAKSRFTIGNPTIESFSPAAEGAINDTVTIYGTGFDPTPANNAVMFNGVPAAVTVATTTALTTVVPPGARTGPVVVTVDDLASRGKTFRVLLASGLSSIGGVAIDPSVSDRVFFTSAGSDDGLFELMTDGTATMRCSIDEPLGLAVSPAGDVYVGHDYDDPSPVYLYQSGGGSCGIYVSDTKTDGNSSSSVASIALSDSAGNLTAYIDDYDNAEIKRIDPNLNVVTIVDDGSAFRSGLELNAVEDRLYYTEHSRLFTAPVPAGGDSTLLKQDAAGNMHGMAITNDDELIVARFSAGSVAAVDPNSTDKPFWDFATGLASPRDVAVGTDGDETFVIVAEPTRILSLPTPSLELTDAADAPLPQKLVVDFDAQTTDCLDANQVNLKITFNPTTLVPDTTPRQQVTWTIEDPDDPSDDPVIDTNDTEGPTGGDNIRLLGTYAQWEGVGDFALDGSATAASVKTEIEAGESRVALRLSCQPGDNYRVRAAVTIPVYGEIDVVSEVITIWRRLHIESDSMGPGGPFDPQDAALDDVPEALLTMFADAFEAAYLEVPMPPDTGKDSPEVTFQNNVDSDSGPAIEEQGRRGRETTSTEGYWVIYIQGSYEGAESADNDPDGEGCTLIQDQWECTDLPALGVTNALNGRYSLTFVETMRDTAANVEVWGVSDLDYELKATALHEVGHQFGLGDGTGCIMEADIMSPVFCNHHLRAIRETLAPGTFESP